MKFKICGLTCMEDVLAVNEAMPDYAGFVFAASRRQVTKRKAEALAAALAPSIGRVGVFVDAPLELAAGLAGRGLIGYIQLHGREQPSYVEELKRRVKVPVIKAVRLDGADEADGTAKAAGAGGTRADRGGRRDLTCGIEASLAAYERAGVDYFLFDSGAGGTGERFDWRRVPATKTPYFLAGGLSPENAPEAIARTGAYALDVSSGVESGGRKDREKVLRFAGACRHVCSSGRQQGCRQQGCRQQGCRQQGCKQQAAGFVPGV